MQQVNAAAILVVADRMSRLETTEWVRQTVPFENEDRKRTLAVLNEVADLCKGMHLPSTTDQVTRIAQALGDAAPIVYPHGWQMMRSLQERFNDDMGRLNFFVVPPNRVELFTERALFGEAVFNLFPSATVDIEEAGKCLALNRATASVFHLMRVMEVGLKVTANALGIPYAPSWESCLKQMKAKLDLEWKDKPSEWRQAEPFFRDVYTHLHAVKLAWRNPTMHVVNAYTPDTAEDVFNAVKGFMRHLATRLSEQTNSEPRPEPLV